MLDFRDFLPVKRNYANKGKDKPSQRCEYN